MLAGEHLQRAGAPVGEGHAVYAGQRLGVHILRRPRRAQAQLRAAVGPVENLADIAVDGRIGCGRVPGLRVQLDGGEAERPVQLGYAQIVRARVRHAGLAVAGRIRRARGGLIGRARGRLVRRLDRAEHDRFGIGHARRVGRFAGGIGVYGASGAACGQRDGKQQACEHGAIWFQLHQNLLLFLRIRRRRCRPP